MMKERHIGIDAFNAAYDTAFDYCQAQGDDVNARVCLGCMSFMLYRTGEWKRALDVCRNVIDEPASPAGSRMIAQAILGLIRANRGETRAARTGRWSGRGPSGGAGRRRRWRGCRRGLQLIGGVCWSRRGPQPGEEACASHRGQGQHSDDR